MALVVDERSYGTLLARVAPRVIQTPEEHARRVAELEALAFREDLTPEEDAWMELLAVLVETYEAKVAPLAEATPAEMLKHLMEQRGLNQVDLLPIFKSRGAVSNACSGKRGISKAQAKKLAELFHVNADCFL